MNNLAKRANYFELENSLNSADDFNNKVHAVRALSEWAAEKLGYDVHEKEAYAKEHINNVIRENEVHKMVKRIQKDLIDSNIVSEEILLDESRDMLKEIHEQLRRAL